MQRPSYFGRRTINTESLSFLDDDDDQEDSDDVLTTRSGRLECFGNARFYRHAASHPSSHDGLAEVSFYFTLCGHSSLLRMIIET